MAAPDKNTEELIGIGTLCAVDACPFFPLDSLVCGPPLEAPLVYGFLRVAFFFVCLCVCVFFFDRFNYPFLPPCFCLLIESHNPSGTS